MQEGESLLVIHTSCSSSFWLLQVGVPPNTLRALAGLEAPAGDKDEGALWALFPAAVRAAWDKNQHRVFSFEAQVGFDL